MAAELAIPFRSVGDALGTHARSHPRKTAIFELDRGRGIDFAGLAEATDGLAAYLAARGIGPGDRVVVLSDERLEKLIAVLGAWRIGAVACPFHVEMDIAHLRAILGYISPRLVLWQRALDGPAILGGLGLESAPLESWPDDGLFAAAGPAPASARNGPGDVACIFATSGTTDRPKCVEWDHLGLWLCGLSTIDFTGMTAADRLLEYRTFSWLSPQILTLMPLVQTGLGVYMAGRFSHRRFFGWIRAHAITVAAGVPTVINMLLSRPVAVERADLATLRLMTSSTAPLAPDQWRRFEQAYGIKLVQLYGASEGGWLAGNRHDRRRVGTVGQPARHMDLAILDGAGAPCPTGREGEIAISGPQTAVATISPEGVYEDRRPFRLTERTPTGDLGVIDADGFLTVTGRVKDLIIRGGVNIAPLEIDRVLASHPMVAEAAAFGVPDAIYGEEVAAFVVPCPGTALAEAEVIAHCAAALPAIKVPKTVQVLAEMPRSERGKIRRDALRRIWLDRASSAKELET